MIVHTCLNIWGVVKIFKQQSMIIYCATAMSLDKPKIGSCLHLFKVNRKKHRSTLETDVELLTCAKTSVCLTKLMYTCNMSFNGLKTRLEDLEAKGLMAHEELGFGKNDSAKKYYCITSLGKEFLASYFRMQNFYSNTDSGTKLISSKSNKLKGAVINE